MELKSQPGCTLTLNEYMGHISAFLCLQQGKFGCTPEITIEELEQLAEECQRVAKSLRKMADDKLNNRITELDNTTGK